MTLVKILRDFPWLSQDSILVGQPVRAMTWAQAAHAVNWLSAAGSHCIPKFFGGEATVAAGSTATYHVQLVQTPQAKYRMWDVAYYADVTPGDFAMTFTDPSGTPHDISGRSQVATADIEDLVEKPVLETIATRTGGIVPATFSFTSGASSTKTACIYTISCFELPRGALQCDAQDLGIAVESILGADAPGPILDGDAYTSLGAVVQGHYAPFKAQPRVQFVWAEPAGQGISTTSATFVPLFEEGPVCLGTKLYRTSTTIAMTVYAYVRTGAATTGELRVTMTSGGTVTIAIPTSTTGAWVTGTVDIDCEDMTAADGRRAGRDDIATVEVRRVSGAGTVAVETVQGIEVRP